MHDWLQIGSHSGHLEKECSAREVGDGGRGSECWEECCTNQLNYLLCHLWQDSLAQWVRLRSSKNQSTFPSQLFFFWVSLLLPVHNLQMSLLVTIPEHIPINGLSVHISSCLQQSRHMHFHIRVSYICCEANSKLTKTHASQASKSATPCVSQLLNHQATD